MRDETDPTQIAAVSVHLNPAGSSHIKVSPVRPRGAGPFDCEKDPKAYSFLSKPEPNGALDVGNRSQSPVEKRELAQGARVPEALYRVSRVYEIHRMSVSLMNSQTTYTAIHPELGQPRATCDSEHIGRTEFLNGSSEYSLTDSDYGEL